MTTDKQIFYRATVSANDFQEAGSYLYQVTPDMPSTLRNACALAAVICYCRPFARSKPYKDGVASSALSLEPEKVLSEKDVILHKRIIEWRNSAVAHSDFEYRPSIVVREEETLYAFSSVPTSHYLEQIDLEAFKGVVEKYRQAALVEAYAKKRVIGPVRE